MKMDNFKAFMKNFCHLESVWAIDPWYVWMLLLDFAIVIPSSSFFISHEVYWGHGTHASHIHAMPSTL